MDEGGGGRSGRLLVKLPGLLMEAASVAFAVLLALAVDQWREDRSNVELAERAQRSIMNEMELNLAELEENAPVLDSLVTYVTEMRRFIAVDDGDGNMDVSVNFQPAFLSRTSWETAQVTRAVHFMDFDEVAQMSRLYDFQALYERSEERMVDMLAGIADLDWDEPAQGLRTLELALRRVDGFGDTLAQLYQARLEFGFGPSPDSAETRTLEFEGSE